MNRPLLPGLALVAGLALAACSEPTQESSLQGPSTPANVVAEPCTPSVFNSLINNYFADNRQAVKNQKDLMLAELNETPADSVTARVHGFNILREIAARSKATPAPSLSTGSELAVEVLQCTFNLADPAVIDQSPAVTAGLFLKALNRTAGGTFEVRGGTGDPTGPVQAAVNNVVIAGIGPLSPATWSSSLNKQVLFYGDTANTGSDYHLSVVPGTVTFGPSLIVTTCVTDSDPSLMMTETGVGALAFSDASHIGCGGPPLATVGGFDLLRHLASLGRDLLLPEPAAATVALASIVGGGAKGRSVYDVDQVTNLVVGNTTVPSPIGKVVVNKLAIQSLTVTVTEDGDPVNGAEIRLSLESNNGTFNGVRTFSGNTCGGAVPLLVTGTNGFPNGTVTFTNLCLIKEGGAKVVMTASVAGRSGTGVGKTAKFTVSPK